MPKFGLIIFLLFSCTHIHAQNHDLDLAQKYMELNQPDSAIPIYEAVYQLTPDAVYSNYINALEQKAQYKDAEKIIKDRLAAHNNDINLVIDLGKVYKLEGKDKQANEQFDGVLQRINGDDMLTQQVAKSFADAKMYDYGARVYEKAGKIINNPYVYTMQLSDMYSKAGELAKSVDLMLTGMPLMNLNVENVKATLLEMVGDSADRIKIVQKAVVAKMNEHPENNTYPELMTWIYTLKNDWDGALLQMEAVDELNKEQGRRLMLFAHIATAAHHYDIADKAYNDIIAIGNASPFFTTAGGEKLSNALAKIKDEPNYTTDEVNNLVLGYDTVFAKTPALYGTPAAADYAMLCAQYGGNAEKGINILQSAIERSDNKRNAVGQLKLQMGDYYLLEGKIWDASLIYSQVDKEFKQDPMGEDARFRNAKLSYYRGDFNMAQHQLRILKAATTELIANDALYLSVLITENTQDSNTFPLERFAHADLLLQQNKDIEAETLLDSLNKAFPKHSLDDDILMLRSKIAEKHHDYPKALQYLTTIYKQFGDDVLGDDAVFNIAEIYGNNIKNVDSAKHYYEQLIIDYPGSTYVQAARQRLNDINNPVNP